MKLTQKRIVASLLSLSIVCVLALPIVALAQTTNNYGLDTGFGDAAGLPTGSTDLPTTIARIINILLGFLGIIAVIIVLYGGFIWMTAAGDSGKVDKAKDLLKAGIIGIVIILAAWAIASWVISTLDTQLRTA